ncbi:MAG: phosphopantetheine-binding protein [Actinophytocola sp.]|uniref:phosphopantetheine-binding protein n=1 Tax=Actinophytocola sp. TaxID=1872138 RepID=UPI003C79280A
MSDPLRDQIAEILDLPADSIGDQDNLMDHGFDSIRMMAMVEELRATGTEVNFMELAEDPTLANWRRLLTPHRP